MLVCQLIFTASQEYVGLGLQFIIINYSSQARVFGLSFSCLINLFGHNKSHVYVETSKCVRLFVQSWGFMSHSTAKVILGQVLSIATHWGQTNTEMTACD